MARNNNALEVSTKGLAKLVGRNGLDWLAHELIQNAWDQRVTTVEVTVESVARGQGQITVVDDDPNGFSDLAHAYTLFAESNKKGDPTLRGRFNLGEKLIIAYCIETGGAVEVLTTTGGYQFSRAGRRRLRTKTAAGSEVTAMFRASKETLADIEQAIGRLLPPSHIATTVNGARMLPRYAQTICEAKLPTLTANDEGDLIRTTRKTSVSLYRPLDGETPMIYELGIPVVENPTSWHIDIGQKVPLNMERDNVTPTYLLKVCALAANMSRDELDEEEASKPWVAKAMESDLIEAKTVTKVLDKKHGKKRVVHDPNRPEASAAAVAQGYSVVYGSSHSGAAWTNIRSHAPVTTASKKFADAGVKFSADGKDCTIPREKWTRSMEQLADYAQRLHEKVVGSGSVQWVNDPRNYSACYDQGGSVLFNKRRLGKSWIDAATGTNAGFVKFIDLCIHEFAHSDSDSHYSDKFYDACTRIGAEVALILAEEGLPEFLK